jgi:hypothetical protein
MAGLSYFSGLQRVTAPIRIKPYWMWRGRNTSPNCARFAYSTVVRPWKRDSLREL